ncbi:MAG: hypothetical protein V1646_01280 [bacterium]
MSTKKILSFVAYFSVVITTNLFCMQKNSSDELLRTLLSNNSSLRNSKEGRQLDKMQMFIGAMDGISERIKTLNEALPKASGEKAIKIANEIRAYEGFLENFQTLKDTFLDNVSNKGNDRKMGIFLAKLFAGPDRGNSLDEDEISGLWSGLAQGLAVPAGEVMKGKAKATIDTYVGGFWDFIFAKLGDFCSTVRNVLFHDCNEPFDPQKLAGWQKMILMAYDDIDNMLRNGLRDSTRSLDSVSRQFDDNGTEVQVKKEIDMWASLAAGYAEQFAYFITLFEKRREYYDEDDIVAFYSNQICQMLQTTCKLLTNSKSLKDLDTKLESQRTIIPAIRKNLCNLFDQLIAEVKPKSSSMKDTGASTTSTYKPNAYNTYGNSYSGAYNNDGPTSFAGGF